MSKILMLFGLAVIAIQVVGAEDHSVIARKLALHKVATGEDLSILSKASFQPKSNVSIQNIRAAQRNDDSKLVDVYYDLVSSGNYQCNVVMEMLNNGSTVAIGAANQEGHVGEGVAPGEDRHIVWNAGKDWPDNYSSKFQTRLTATETDIPKTWATITIAWAAYGGSDIDICGYWLDKPDVKVGWSWGSGSTDSVYSSRWKGDNTGSGPEYILVGASAADLPTGVTTPRYRIHFNHYGRAGSPPKVDVSVRANNVTRSKTQTAATRGGKALTSDPYLTITFDQDGTPRSID